MNVHLQRKHSPKAKVDTKQGKDTLQVIGHTLPYYYLQNPEVIIFPDGLSKCSEKSPQEQIFHYICHTLCLPLEVLTFNNLDHDIFPNHGITLGFKTAISKLAARTVYHFTSV